MGISYFQRTLAQYLLVQGNFVTLAQHRSYCAMYFRIFFLGGPAFPW